MNKNNNNNNLGFLIHITAIAVFICIALAFYFIAGQKDVNNLVKNAENMYKEKVEDTQKIKSANIIKKEENKQLKPFVKYSFKYTYILNTNGQIMNVDIKIPIPQDESEKQYISSLQIEPKPFRTYRDGENNIAEYKYNELNAGTLNITVSGIANIRTYDYYTASIINKNPHKETDLSRYLKSEKLIESDDPIIKRIAVSLKGQSQRETVNNVFNYTNKNLTYKMIPYDLGAKEALRQKQGKCSEFSAVMIALLRANNIPARLVNGNIARETNQRHGWVEVYYDNLGWVAYDPTAAGPTVKIYKNGQLVEQEKKIIPEKAFSQYIASLRNAFSPIDVSFLLKNKNVQAGLDMKTEIQKLQH